MTHEAEEEIIEQLRTVLELWTVELVSHKQLPHKRMQCPYCETGMYKDMKENVHIVEHGPLCSYTRIARIIGESSTQRIK